MPAPATHLTHKQVTATLNLVSETSSHASSSNHRSIHSNRFSYCGENFEKIEPTHQQPSHLQDRYRENIQGVGKSSAIFKAVTIDNSTE